MERDNNLFYDCSSLRETPGIRQRAETGWLQNALGDPDIRVVSVAINDSGVYKRLLGNITGLPPFVDVRLRHRTGVHEENIIISAADDLYTDTDDLLDALEGLEDLDEGE